MSNEPRIRETVAGDEAALTALYKKSFPDEDLTPLMKRLLAEVPDILSLVAMIGEECAGHILFTPCTVEESGHRVALLGPLAVAPPRQGQGLGKMLIRNGFSRLSGTDLPQVLVLGDPAFYGRFGFLPETSIIPPYDLPAAWAAAWQSVTLAEGAMTRAGILRPPAAWLSQSLWLP